MRFRLRSLLLAVAAFSILCAVWAAATRDIRKRSRVTKELNALGASYVAFNDDCEPRWVAFPHRIKASLGAKFDALQHVDLAYSSVQDDDLRFLTDLPKLEYLHLTNTAITDAGLEHISKIESLRMVRLEGTKITDSGIETLASLPNLKGVDLQNTLVTEQGIERLESLKPGIGISY